MRCLALAQAWQRRGGGATFLSHCEGDGIKRRVTQEGFRFVEIPKPWPDEEDLRETLAAVLGIEKEEERTRPLWVVLDGYHFNGAYQKAIRDTGIPLLILDDVGHWPEYHADALLNAGIGADRSLYPSSGGAKLLLGIKYLLLRREFLEARALNKDIPDKAERILVTLGGADSKNVTSRILEGLSQIVEWQLKVKMVVGSMNPHVRRLKEKAAPAGSRFEILEDVHAMTELMAWADLAIAGGGATCCELAFMGVPSLIVVLSENQKRLAEGLDGRCSISLGNEKNLVPEKIAQAVEALVPDQEKRKRMSLEGRQLVDGLGADRVVDEMMGTIQRGTGTSWRMS
ncbi:MAG: UDP-2,4-diacetamido-2,4,6-trideoxy-beta-L-altropyranose hydrolase [Desulfobacterota bacterium]|nr:UDP-2,4-diacetamido-2,4,6-trideoxy-beta-L-altropyranose hydrolase [Thermodesulfobacteriota bacterium]